jgi:hypothetical protein
MPISSYIGPLVTYNWNPTTQLTELLADLAGVESGTGRGATVAFLGDSVTDGFETALSNYVATTSLPAQFTKLTLWARATSWQLTQTRE